ncbi:membrane protein [Xenorhabdus mauleonii]|uniref:Membrane protein n=1 Tax=Xenorhabdus mauleonii TaxID=351675 RepID=A0A1I3WVJ1_9GAMM|nr:DUF1240 domain-containing protein [Xenorhabdus mauleonii]PHM38142.1 membrane protein [Xenorhabdus mauleonii]SFK10421.1 Protein of unknown function [Xenorhabdus mauleonii]
MTVQKRIGTILFLLAFLLGYGFVVFLVSSDLIAVFKMEDSVKFSWVMFNIIFLSPFIFYFCLWGLYLSVTLKPEELQKKEKKKKGKRVPTLNERLMIIFLVMALIGLVAGAPLSWYMHFKFTRAGYVVCESTSSKAPSQYAKEKKFCR